MHDKAIDVYHPPCCDGARIAGFDASSIKLLLIWNQQFKLFRDLEMIQR
jgi:hypothetical protein